MTRRLKDWRGRLQAYLSEVATQPFRPGRHDCALFAAGAVKAMTGRDLARGYRSKYRSLARGRELLRAQGFEDPVALVAAHFEEVAPIMAREGDIAVLVDEDAALAFGVVQGAGIYVLRPAGLGLAPLSHAVRAFRV